MRFKRRSAAIIALAVAGALSVAGIALAATSSTASFKFTPSKVSKTTFRRRDRSTSTRTRTTADANSNYTDRAQLYFDNDFTFNTGAVPKCNKTNISGTKTMAQAMAACGAKLIGKGTATRGGRREHRSRLRAGVQRLGHRRPRAAVHPRQRGAAVHDRLLEPVLEHGR